jgi:hypothetical protein
LDSRVIETARAGRRDMAAVENVAAAEAVTVAVVQAIEAATGVPAEIAAASAVSTDRRRSSSTS